LTSTIRDREAMIDLSNSIGVVRRLQGRTTHPPE